MKKFFLLFVVFGIVFGVIGYFLGNSTATGSPPPLTDWERANFLPDLYLQEAGKKLEKAGSYKFDLQWITVNDKDEKLGSAEIKGAWAANGDMMVDEINYLPDGSQTRYAYAFTNGKMMKAVTVDAGKDKWVWETDENEVKAKKYYVYVLLLEKAGHLFEHLGPALYLAEYQGQTQVDGKEVHIFKVSPDVNQRRFLETEDMKMEDLFYEFAVSVKDNTLIGAQIHATYNTPQGKIMNHITILYSNFGTKVKLPEVKEG
jgi:hypothetical protein